MKDVPPMFAAARIPYGTWGSSFFPAWQMSALAEVNIGQFAGEAMNRIMGIRKIPTSALEYLIIGSTIPCFASMVFGVVFCCLRTPSAIVTRLLVLRLLACCSS